MRTLPLVLVLLLAPAFPAASGGPSPLRLEDALAALGTPSIPPAWAGIWEFEDDEYDCATNAHLSSSTSQDTLCANAPVFGDPGFGDWSCSGTVDDTSVDVSCSASEEIDTGCVVTFTSTLVATRSGDAMTSTMTFSQTFEPEGCAFLPNSCRRRESTATRIGPPPGDCTTAVVPETWGRTKARYRE